jgi:hypothetical protein
MTLFQSLFSGQSSAGNADVAQLAEALISTTAPRLLAAAELAQVAGGPQTQNDER